LPRRAGRSHGLACALEDFVKAARLLVVLAGLLLLLALCGSAFAQTAPQSIMTMKSSLGVVKFDHTAHVEVAGRCEVCHHPSKPEKPLKSAHEACTDCHTTPATPPATTKTQAAFHNPTATAGLCIDCHKRQNASGKAAPVKCADCHKKNA
jgi:hypothetical protein